MFIDCWYQVFQHLSFKERTNCERVCSSWREAILSQHAQQKVLGTRQDDVLDHHRQRSSSNSNDKQCLISSHNVRSHDLIPSTLVTADHLSSFTSILRKCSNLKSLKFTIKLNPTCQPDHQVVLIANVFAVIAENAATTLECLAFEVEKGGFRVLIPPTLVVEKLNSVWSLICSSRFSSKLKHIKLPFISSEGLSQLLSSCSELEEVDMRVLDTPLNGEVLSKVSTKFKRLNVECLLTESGLHALITRCPNSLVSLAVGAISQAFMREVCRHFVNLRELSFNLRTDFAIQQADFEEFRQLSSLDSLSIKSFSCKHFDGALLVLMKHLGHSLRSITLAGFLITDLSLAFIGVLCPQVERLTIGNTLFHVNMEEPGITDDTLRALSRLSNLRTLDIDTPNIITETGIVYLLQTVSKLRLLSIWDTKRPVATRKTFEACMFYSCSKVTADEQVSVTLDNNTDTAALKLVQVLDEAKPNNLHLTVRIGSQCYIWPSKG